MKLASAAVLLLLVVAPLLVALAIRDERRRRARLALLGDSALLGRQADGNDARPLTFRLEVAAAVLLIVAIAGPRIGSHTELLPRRGLDVIFALDVSRSMRARDVAPDRLERAKAEISSFIDEIGENRVGLVAFAGTAFVQCPLTSDVEAVRGFARGLEPELVPQGGTALALGLETAARAFESDDEDEPVKEPRGRVLVVFTDGEDHEGGLERAAERLRALGVETFVIGLGSTLGEPIPLVDKSGVVTDYVKDREGKTVVSRMSPDVLSLVADKAGGRFIDGTRERDLGLAAVAQTVARLEKRELEARVRTTYEDRSEWPLALALACLALAFGAPWLARRRRPPAVVVTAAIVVITLASPRPAHAELLERVEPELAEGISAMQRGDDGAALEHFERTRQRAPDESAVVEYNKGSVHLRALEKIVEEQVKAAPGAPDPGGERQKAIDERAAKAREAFERAATLSTKKELRSDAHLARGNTHVAEGDLAKAIAAYRDALVENPANGTARNNLKTALTLMRASAPPPSEGQDGDEQKQEGGDEEKEQQGGGKSGGDDEESADDAKADPGEGKGEGREEGEPRGDQGRDDAKGEDSASDESGADDAAEDRAHDDERADRRDEGSGGDAPRDEKRGQEARGKDEKRDDDAKDGRPAPAPATQGGPERKDQAAGGGRPMDDREKAEARRLLDAMRRNEKPLQPFQMRSEQRRLIAPAKDW